MAVSDRTRGRIGRRTSISRGTSRYDVYLAAIPLLFLAAVSVGLLLPASVEQSVLAASVIGAAILADGLFLNPPEVGDSR